MRLLHAWIYKSTWTTLFLVFIIYGLLVHDIRQRNNLTVWKYGFRQSKATNQPAVTLCHKSEISERKVDEALTALEMNTGENFRKDFVSALEVLVSFDSNPGLVGNLSSGAIKILNDHKDQLPNILKHVSFILRYTG